MWQGEEVASLPKCAGTTFNQLVQRWLKFGVVPNVLLEARQVQLPKPGKANKKGQYKVEGLRPITVMSVWWRVVESAIGKLDGFKQLTSKLPEAFLGSSGAEAVAAKALQQWCEQGFIACLDFSKAFDMMDPEIVTEVMRELGVPNEIVEVLKQVWVQHKRWICVNQHYSQVPLGETRAHPQGSPMGPMVCGFFLAAGLAAAMRRQDKVKIDQSVYVDDRTIVSKTAKEVIREVLGWQGWS